MGEYSTGAVLPDRTPEKGEGVRFKYAHRSGRNRVQTGTVAKVEDWGGGGGYELTVVMAMIAFWVNTREQKVYHNFDGLSESETRNVGGVLLELEIVE